MTDLKRRLNVIESQSFPAYVVWELTLLCDHACTHCGSRAGKPRNNELSTIQALEIVKQLKDMGTQEIVLIGGEAYLHPGFIDIIKAIKKANIRPVMTTGGFGITPSLAHQMAEAGLQRASVSIDGTDVIHDQLRHKKGSFLRAIQALRHLKQAGIAIAANTQINSLNLANIEALYNILIQEQVTSWQVQITAPLGRAADNPEILLQPNDLLHLMPQLANLKRRGREHGLLLMLGNNLGYFGPDEGLLRSQNAEASDHFRGCQAGRFVLGIESNGDVKGCPSLQSAYISGNLTKNNLDTIWQSPSLGFTKQRSVSELWGFCAQCDFKEVCMGGCSFTAHALFGKRGNQPYCYHRASQLKKQGLRERLVKKHPAIGQPFDHGLFEIITETIGPVSY